MTFKTGYELAQENVKMELNGAREKEADNQKGWDVHFLQMARLVSTRSKDESTKVGCVMVGPKKEVITTGYNGFPRGIENDDPAKSVRPEKYIWTEHAERNAIYLAAERGAAIGGTTAYVTCPPCPDCARALIQCGIVRVVIPANHAGNNNPPKSTWWDHIGKAQNMLAEAGIKVEVIYDE